MRKAHPFLGASLTLLALSWASMAKAQDAKPFSDVKPDHWAYQAVTDLQQKGVIVGYPDGFFRGQRVLTRYEFALALKRALDKIGPTTGAAGEKGPAGEKGDTGPTGPTGPMGPAGIPPEAVDELRRLAGEFKNDLTALGANMAAVGATLDKLSTAVDAINRRLDRMIQFNGDFFVGTRSDQSRFSFLDYSGAGRPASPSLFDNIATPHDFHLEAHANLPGGVRFNGDLVTSNYLAYRGGTLAPFAAAQNNGGPQFTSLYEANLQIPLGKIGNNVHTRLTCGRFREQITPLTYLRPDYDAYFSTPWYDDGSYIQDGFAIDTTYTGAHSVVFGGAFSSVQGGDRFPQPTFGLNTPFVGSAAPTASIAPLFQGRFGMGNIGLIPFDFQNPSGSMTPGQVVGLHAGIPLFKYGEIAGTLLDFSSTNGGANGGFTLNGVPFGGNPIGNVVVYGANFKLNPIGHFMVSGEASKSVTQRTFTEPDGRNNDDNNAFNINAGYNTGPVIIQGGYQYIDPRFAAPGYWNKIGNWYNPTNVQGPFARVGYRFSDKLNVNVGGDYLNGARNRPGIGEMTMGSSILRGECGVNWQPCKHVDVSAKYEGVFRDLSSAVSASGMRAKPIEQYITIGAGVRLTGDTTLKFAYQMIGVRDNGDGFGLGTQFGGPAPGGNLNANVFTTQVAVHF
ncbi:MAG TPA: S-layer homology domain-containing protein [Chthonomonadaceae bacterium]|nr:S-layer homology domain-containing protein [Chthonomonadaceae bacterium]